MEKMKVAMRQMLGLTLVVFVMLLLTISSSEAASQPQRQRGGVMKIIDVSEGAQPIGAPWEVRGIDVKLIRPAVESLLREDIKGNYSPWAGHGVENRYSQEYHYPFPQKGRQVSRRD